MASSEANFKAYQDRTRLVSYPHPRLKELVVEDARQMEISHSEIVEVALREYYDRRPEHVENLRQKMGKHRY